MKSILSHWNIKYKNIIEIQRGVWSIDEDYILKVYDNKEWIRNLLLYKELSKNGIPTPEAVSTIQGEEYYMQDNSYYFLTHKIIGNHLSKEEVMGDLEAARLVGQVIAKLHKAFSAVTDEFAMEDMNFVTELKGWVKKILEEYAADSFTNNIFQDCVSKLEKVYNKLERHIIHRDIHLGNLLFVGNELTGYIDFDLTQVNARIFDIAYILSGWLAGEVNNDKFIDNWKQTVRSVINGYQEEQELSEIEIKSIVIMMCCIEMLFVAYFCSINELDNSAKAEECLKWLWENQKAIL